MPLEAKIFTLQRAWNIHPDKAKELVEKLENELKYQEMLLNLVEQKAHLSEKETLELDEIKKIRMAKARKGEGKKERKIRLEYYQLIKKLRAEGFGWRRISEYLRTYHHQKISYLTIRNVYLKIKEQIGDEDEE